VDNKDFNNVFIVIIKDKNILFITFIINKEKSNIKLILKLRRKSIIIIFRYLFKAFQKKEINGLIIKGVFNFTKFDYIKYTKVRIFNSKLINEIKSKTTNNLYKKLKFIIQNYNNNKKQIILI